MSVISFTCLLQSLTILIVTLATVLFIVHHKMSNKQQAPQAAAPDPDPLGAESSEHASESDSLPSDGSGWEFPGGGVHGSDATFPQHHGKDGVDVAIYRRYLARMNGAIPHGPLVAHAVPVPSPPLVPEADDAPESPPLPPPAHTGGPGDDERYVTPADVAEWRYRRAMHGSRGVAAAPTPTGTTRAMPVASGQLSAAPHGFITLSQPKVGQLHDKKLHVSRSDGHSKCGTTRNIAHVCGWKGYALSAPSRSGYFCCHLGSDGVFSSGWDGTKPTCTYQRLPPETALGPYAEAARICERSGCDHTFRDHLHVRNVRGRP